MSACRLANTSMTSALIEEEAVAHCLQTSQAGIIPCGPARAIMLQKLCGHMRFLEHGLGLSLCCYDFCVSLRRDNLGSRAVSAKRSESSTNRGIIAVSDFRTFQSKLKVDCVPGNFIAVALPTCWDKEWKTSVLQGRVALGQSASPVRRVGQAVAKTDFVI